MEDFIVLKTDKLIDEGLLAQIAKVTKSTVVILPLSCAVLTGEEALRELRNYKELLKESLT